MASFGTAQPVFLGRRTAGSPWAAQPGQPAHPAPRYHLEAALARVLEAGPATAPQPPSSTEASFVTTMSMATRFSPPSGMMTSAHRREGSTKSRCMGRTDSRY
jgi:hypothetical protein